MLPDFPTFHPIESKSLAEAVAEQLMALIAKGQLKPGDRLPTEPELMNQFGVGRSTLREAVKSLVVAGLLETRRSAGTFVSESYTDYLSQSLNWGMVFSKQELRHIIDVRCALEEQAAALAAEFATDEQKAHLAELVDAISAQGIGPEQAVENDIGFHIAIAEASNNPLLLNLILNLRQVLHGYIKAGYQRRGYADQVNAQEMADLHRPILQAIQAGQPAAAKRAMHTHFQNTTGWQLAQAEE
ncbi:MAG: FadR family transcriptional regulator [Chloroflexi bacterium]|jgi:GntR family transcriptional regulator, transcriptional repressor for pyruvate dehydrogenase complex|nr:FadR family transcriptional regulator [Chloroflexota bacterium]